MTTDLDKLRKQIDAIDTKLLELINQRAAIVLEIAKAKSQSTNPVIYRPEREAKVLSRMIEKNKGPMPNEQIVSIFRIIMSASRAIQHNINIAYLGPEGTFSHAAAQKQFGTSNILTSKSSIKDVFTNVESKKSNYGVIPIENSLGGIVPITLDLLIESPIKLCGEIVLPIHQNLLVNPKHQQPIKRIYSHQQSLMQCCKWIDANYPNAERVAVSSNAYAAKLTKEEQGTAAIASQLAAKLYELDIQAEYIEDNPNNTTRFLIIGNQIVPPSGNDKTSLLITSIANKPGILAKIIQPFAEKNINITLMEWRPYRRELWNYVFFLDISGHSEDSNVKKALAVLEASGILVTILGSYPKAIS